MIFLDYAYSEGQSFTEVIRFPGAKTVFSSEEQDALDRILRALHLAAGISYYKAFCPPQIIIETKELSPAEADFFYKFYLLGLGEFSVENNIDLRKVINFPATAKDTPPCGIAPIY